MLSENDKNHFRRAIELAKSAERVGNLPIGAVITLNNEVIAEGKNKIWHPTFSGTRHAEIEAIHSVPNELWPRSREMTLYSTLEPCLMCTGAILLHYFGRVVFGASDSIGGGTCVFGHMPPYLENELQQTQWIGPAFHEECDELFLRAKDLIAKRQDSGLIV